MPIKKEKNDKKDFRRGNTARRRTAEAIKAIREALSPGEANFEALMGKTGLSRPALASNLKKLRKRWEVERRIDSEDHRVKHYSLTDKGLKQYAKQNDIVNLEKMESMPVGDAMGIIKESIATLLTMVTSPPILEIPSELIDGLDEKAPQSRGKDTYWHCIKRVDDVTVPMLSKEEQEILFGCLNVSVYSRTVDNKTTGFVEALKELLESVKLVASNDVDVNRLKRLPNLTFMFQFSRDKLIQQYEQLKKTQTGNAEDFS